MTVDYVCRRYIPIGLLERYPIHLNDWAPGFYGRNDLETLMGSSKVGDSIASTAALSPSFPPPCVISAFIRLTLTCPLFHALRGGDGGHTCTSTPTPHIHPHLTPCADLTPLAPTLV